MSLSPLKNLINSKRVIFISPFTENVMNGVTWRINFIKKSLMDLTSDIYFCYRGAHYFPTVSFLPTQNTFVLSSNRFFNLLNPLFIFKIWSLKIGDGIIFCNTIWSGFYGLFFFFFWGTPFVFDNHNVEFSRFKSYGSFLQYPVWFLENILLKYAAMVTVSSVSDKLELEKIYGSKNNIQVIENVFSSGLTIKPDREVVLKNLCINTDKKLILFFGSMQYYPNQEALFFIKTDIVPYLDSSKCFVIVAGLDSEKFIDPGDSILGLGFVNDLDSLVAISDLVIAPLFSGAGVKIKIIHALSFGKKVVTTSEGSRGIMPQQNMIIATKENFLSHINICLNI